MTRSWTITELDKGFLIRERLSNGVGEHTHTIDRTYAAESLDAAIDRLRHEVEKKPRYLEHAQELRAFTT